MTRPTHSNIVSGEEAWDAEVDTNFDIIFANPFPPYEHASASLATFSSAKAPGTYDRCIAALDESTRGWVLVFSNGTTWEVIAREPSVVALSDASTIAVDAAALGPGGVGRVTLGDNRTLGNPTNPIDGQTIYFEITQDGTGSKTLAYDTAYRFSTDLAEPTLTTTTNAKDYLAFRYNATDSKWDCVLVIKGY